MSDNDIEFEYELLDVPDESFGAIADHIQKELNRDYRSATAKNGKRRFPYAVKRAQMVGEDGLVELSDGDATVKVSLSLPVFDIAGGYSSIQCSCQGESFQLETQRCWHMWVAQKAILWLFERQSSNLNADDRVLTELFADLEQLASAEEAADAGETEERIAFIFTDFDRWSPVLQKRYRGEWTQGLELSWPELKSHEALLVVQGFTALPGLVQNLSSQPKFWTLIEEVYQNAAIFLEGDLKQALEVKKTPIVLKGKIADDGFSIEPRFENTLAVTEVLGQRVAFGLDRSQKLLCFSPVPKDLARFYQKLCDSKLLIPLQDKDRLFQYLSRIGARVPVSLEGGEQVTAESANQLYLRLNPLPNDFVKVELLVKPSPTGAYFPPGSGPESILDLTDSSQPVERQRDLWQESDHAANFVRDLSLEDWHWQGNQSFVKDYQKSWAYWID